MAKFSQILIFFMITVSTARATELGIGLSSSMDGRSVPAASIGVPIGNHFLLSASSAGVQSKSYFHNSYTMSFLKWIKATKTLFGEPSLGLGLGMHYGIRGYSPDPEDESIAEKFDKDVDFGPAFRLSMYPLDSFYYGFEFVMGLGPGVLGLGFADSGSFSVGVVL